MVIDFQCKIWLKPSAEQQFLYGNHVSKAGLGRISENCAKYQGVLVFSMSDLPLGFGVAAKSTSECKMADPLSSICFHQADIGEYIRNEEELLQKNVNKSILSFFLMYKINFYNKKYTNNTFKFYFIFGYKTYKNKYYELKK